MNSIERWVEQSRYDLETARAMYATGRYLYVVFCCQQAIEKTLKAIIVKATKDFPPRIHNLLRLAEMANIDLAEEHNQFLRELSTHYIQSRYPEQITSLSAMISVEKAKQILDQTEETLQWLNSMI